MKIVENSLYTVGTLKKGGQMTVWELAIDTEFCSYNELKERKVVAQGWRLMGDLSKLLPIQNQIKFKKVINAYLDYFYENLVEKRNPARIFLNLLSIKNGDFVICCEGETVKGIAKISKELNYEFDTSGALEYAHSMAPVEEWKDILNQNHGIKIKAMGPVGIQRYHGNIDIESLFEFL